MQIRSIFLTLSFAIIFAAVVGALIANSTMDDRNAMLVATQETSLQDGASLINGHCARCHTVELIKQTKHTRAEWGNTLAQMEKIGVTLSEDEKIVLIEYLTAVIKP